MLGTISLHAKDKVKLHQQVSITQQLVEVELVKHKILLVRCNMEMVKYNMEMVMQMVVLVKLVVVLVLIKGKVGEVLVKCKVEMEMVKKMVSCPYECNLTVQHDPHVKCPHYYLCSNEVMTHGDCYNDLWDKIPSQPLPGYTLTGYGYCALYLMFTLEFGSQAKYNGNLSLVRMSRSYGLSHLG
uniref:Uncharacterized protein n=1 Tax=Tanacetum cinerariifolium TaxID=118510 RepID=A0A6L2N4P8_TANCI|nr:hypothetical protein [Tanacetum cinerariifolium]